ncbi:unnamed protein product [Durusdinium trenchii]|uniref:Uncharacterized protein n=1 Tax=Durusdinium trenchii TaxID=1381693 RepID=A0ABP0KHV8_9DINO
MHPKAWATIKITSVRASKRLPRATLGYDSSPSGLEALRFVVPCDLRLRHRPLKRQRGEQAAFAKSLGPGCLYITWTFHGKLMNTNPCFFQQDSSHSFLNA